MPNRIGFTRDLGRRAAIGGIMAASLAPSLARAAIVNLVAVGKDGWLFPIWDEVRHTDLKRVAAVAGVLNTAVGTLKAANIKVAIALTPIKSRVYREYLPEDFRFVPDTESRYTRILEELRRPGTIVGDMLVPLMAARTATPGDHEFFKADTHWTADASQAAAADLARIIRASAALPPSAKPGTPLAQPSTATWDSGDLAALLPPADGAKYPIENYAIRQPVVAEGNRSLIEADGADVAIVGNSFMQPRLGFAAMLSNQMNRPVTLAWKVHQVGPYQTLLKYIASEAFTRRRPALIVWNLHETDMTLPADSKDGWGQNAMAPQAFLTALQQAVAAR